MATRVMHTTASRLSGWFTKAEQFFRLTTRPVPEEEYPDMNDPLGLSEHNHGIWSDLLHTSFSDYRTLEEALKLEAEQKPWNDRQFLLEHIIQVCYDRRNFTESAELTCNPSLEHT